MKSHVSLPSALFITLFSLFVAKLASAGSATWIGDPTYHENLWYLASSWTPNTVPNGPSDIATFGVSSETRVNAEAPLDELEVNSVVFSPGASAFTIGPRINFSYQSTFTLSGVGIINNSGIMQNFVVTPIDQDANGPNTMIFANSATAGDNLTQIAVNGTEENEQYGGLLEFIDSSTAGSSIISNLGGAFNNGTTEFHDSATAGNASITNGAGTLRSGRLTFYDSSSAGNATIVNEAAVGNAFSSATIFSDSSDAANSTIVCNDGNEAQGTLPSIRDPQPSAYLTFSGDSTGGTARVMLFGTSALYLTSHNAPGITFGSLEGEGSVSLALAYFGGTNLTIGSNNLSTVFSGVISENDAPGSVTKIGTGSLALAGANAYTGGTTIQAGQLAVNNASGSGTGTGQVFVNAGTLSGRGTIAGAVVVGTGSGAGAFLAPGARGVRLGTLTIRKKLLLKGDSTYKVTLDSRVPTADAVRAKGMRIQGASILVNDLGANVLPAGTVFVIMSNTATGPISGHFRNLADGSTVTIGSNNFQANYEGGDGNDLTLTVVP